ncbi:MAG: hypothetical protein GEV12_06890 [Micromonosporaceae bacterium]|nr:hypothetical protein [Micromonosporaceae bacterium]
MSVVTACGTDDDGGGGSSGGGNGDTELSVTILQPASGDTVSIPFTLEVDASEDLGPTDSGLHHVHVYFDGDDSNYEVIEEGNRVAREITADSPAVAGLPPGEHTLNISLRNADHSAAGAEAEVAIVVDNPASG